MSCDYYLSPEGLASLRQAIQRTKPWAYRTPEGLKRSAQNARKTGHYTAQAIAERRAANARRKLTKAIIALLALELRRRAEVLGTGRVPMPASMPHVRADERYATCLRRVDRWARQWAKYDPDAADWTLSLADQARRRLAERGHPPAER